MKLIWFFLILLPLNQVLAQNLETGFVDSFLSYFNTPAVSENCDPILPHLSSCPLFLNQTTEQDQKSMLFTSISAEQDCSRTKLKEDFNSSREFEEFLKNKAPFKSLSPLPLLSGKCFSEGISPERKNELIAEYYNSAYRLESGLDRDLSALSTIDLLLGAKSLTGIDCADFSQTKALNTSCRELKACSNSNDAYLQQSAEDTLTALEGLASIDKKLKTLQRQKRKARRDGSLDKTKIEDLKKEKKNIENLYPWILGDKFKSQYDENKSYTVNEMSELIKAQLKDTRENLNVSLEDKSQAYNCVIYNSGCEELSDRDIRLSLAGSPSFDRESIFSSMEQLKAVRDEDLGQLSPSEKQALKQDLIAGSYFEQTQCREKIREDVRYVKKESALLALDVGLTFATVGLAGAAVTGRLAVKMGSKFAPNMTKAQRLQNLGLIGLDVSFTAPYAKEVMDQCEQDMDKLESLAVKETNDNSSLCQNQKSRIKHTSDLKNCILMASLVSLPITLPLAGVGVRVIAKRSNPALEQRKELAERSLGKSLSGKQVRAVEQAHLAGRGERGKDGSLAGIGNYTESQLRQKNKTLRSAGFGLSERRKLMESGVVGDRDRRPGDYDIPSTEEALSKIRGNKKRKREKSRIVTVDESGDTIKTPPKEPSLIRKIIRSQLDRKSIQRQVNRMNKQLRKKESIPDFNNPKKYTEWLINKQKLGQVPENFYGYDLQNKTYIENGLYVDKKEIHPRTIPAWLDQNKFNSGNKEVMEQYKNWAEDYYQKSQSYPPGYLSL